MRFNASRMTYAAGGFSLNAQGDSGDTHHKPLSLPLDSVLVELASLLCEAPHKILKKSRSDAVTLIGYNASRTESYL